MLRETTCYMQEVQSELELSKAELFRKNENLEEIVKERTSDLTKAYEAARKEVEVRKNIQLELQETNKELNILLYKASHDLKAPVSTSFGLINLLKIAGEKESLPQFLGMMEDTLGKLETILQELTRIVNIKQDELNYTSVDLKETIVRILNKKCSQNVRNGNFFSWK